MYDYNFGNIYFNWGETKETSSFEVILKDINNNERIKHTIHYNELIYNYDSHNLSEEERDCQTRLESRFKPLSELIFYYIANPLEIYSPILIFSLLGIHIFVLYLIIWIFYKIIKCSFSFIFKDSEKAKLL